MSVPSGNMDPNGQYHTAHATPVRWDEMDKVQVAEWAIGGFRQHLIAILTDLEQMGAEVVSVSSLRQYILSVDADVRPPVD